MSRTLSNAAIQQLLTPDADDPLILLVSITAPNNVPGPDTLRFANAWTTRLTSLETDESLTVYGVTSRGDDYVFLPIDIVLPQSDDAAPRARISLHDVTREAMPLVRGVTGAPSVLLELVLASDPDTVEMTVSGLVMSDITYNKDVISADLVADNLALEPFPSHTFVPANFPGLFTVALAVLGGLVAAIVQHSARLLACL